MGFSGDLKNIGLADVFQNIASNRLTGTLRIFDQEEERYIYFGEGSVNLYAQGGRKGSWIAEALVSQNKITESQKKKALKTKQKSRKLLQGVLVELEFLTPEEFAQALKHYMEEEIYEVFSWKNASFEFTDGSPPPLFDEELVEANIKIDSYSIIMEAARRLDEWDKIRKHIASMEDVFIVESQPADSSSLTREEKKVLPLLDGSKTLAQIIETLGESKFEISKAVFQLIQKGHVRLVNVEELVQVAEKHLEDREVEEAIRVFERALEIERHNLDIRHQLAEVLEGEERFRDAAEQFKVMAFQHLSDREVDKAIHCYRRAVVLDPTDTSIQEKLLSLYLENNRLDRALSAGRALASTYQELGMPSKACQVYEKLIVYDDQPRLHLWLAKAYVISNDNPEGLKHYYEAARSFLDEGKEDRALEAYELARELDPRPDSEASKKIREIKEGRIHHKKRMRKRLGIISVSTVFFVLLILALVYEGIARYHYSRDIDRAFELLAQNKIEEAYLNLYGSYTSYPYSPTASEAKKYLHTLASIQLQRAREAEDREDFLEAFQGFQKVKNMPVVEEEILQAAQRGVEKWKGKKLSNRSAQKVEKDRGDQEAKKPPKKEFPPLLPQRNSLDKYWKFILKLKEENELKRARKGLKKFIPFLEEQPKRLQHFYLRGSRDLLKKIEEELEKSGN